MACENAKKEVNTEPFPSSSADEKHPAAAATNKTTLAARLLFGLLAMFGGVCLSFAVNIGAVFSKYTKDPLRSACIHFSISTTCMVGFCVVKKMWRRVNWDQLEGMQWWYVPLPGVIGSSLIAASFALTPQITFGTYVGFFVFGQVATSLLCDHFAVLGTPKTPLTLPRVLVTVSICAAVGISEGFNPSQTKHSWWVTLLLCVACVAVGVLHPFQALLNKLQSERYGSPVSGACVSYIFGTVWLGFISVLSLAWSPLDSDISSAPWYVWFSGLLGPVFVTASCICPKYLGASLFFVSVVVGQLGTSILIDATKLFPDNARDVTWVRCVCIVIVAIGVAVKNYLHERMVRLFSKVDSSSVGAEPLPISPSSSKSLDVITIASTTSSTSCATSSNNTSFAPSTATSMSSVACENQTSHSTT